MLEVTLTVLVMGILAAVTVPKFAFVLDQYRVDAAAKRIQHDLALAQRYAIASSTSKTVQFSSTSSTYSLLGISDPNHPSQTYSVNLRLTPYEVILTSASLGGDELITFNLYGQPDSGGTVTVRSGSTQQTVTVQSVTGQATIP